MDNKPTGTLNPQDAMSLAYQERTNRAALGPGMLNHRHNTGQIFTPLKVAERAAQSLDLFPKRRQGRRNIHIVDGGMGDGQLTLAVLAELGKLPETDRRDTVRLTGIEQDPVLARAASTNVRAVTPWCEQRKMTIEASVIVDDFTKPERWRHHPDHPNAATPIDICITNPPYRRLRADAPETTTAIETGLAVTGNTYTLFCEMGWRVLEDWGQLTAITPRSFQHGARFREFRNRMREHLDIDRFHIWKNRSQLYGLQNVIQETTCWHGRKNHPSERRQNRPLVVVTHGNREQSTTWVWTTPGNRKWIHEGGCEHRLKTNADRMTR